MDLGRVEFNLDLHVPGNSEQGGIGLVNQDLADLAEGVDVGAVPLPFWAR